MILKFSKYQGTGNDFIMLDNRNGQYAQLSIQQIRFLCDRRFGIGADGLIRLSSHATADFYMDYFNADGSQSFCGNGARCTVAFAAQLGLKQEHYHFEAIDGMHDATWDQTEVSLRMKDVSGIKQIGADYVVHTGSPHYIRFVDNALNINVVHDGKQIRYSPDFQEEGINVNFVEKYNSDEIEVCTYERGVEDETLSCGTGVTAAAITTVFADQQQGQHEVRIHTKGGKLKVAFHLEQDQATEIRLIGPAIPVFDGEIEL